MKKGDIVNEIEAYAYVMDYWISKTGRRNNPFTEYPNFMKKILLEEADGELIKTLSGGYYEILRED